MPPRLGLQHAKDPEQQQDSTDAEQGRRGSAEQQCPADRP